MNTTELVQALREPEAYPGGVEEVGFLQTHISLLFFAGERVYKIKKPVDLGFLDFTTLERRLHFCREEVRLNRRLTPWMYRGVVPVCRADDGTVRIGGTGEPIEWAVEMVRLPDERMLVRLLERGEIDNQQLNDLAVLLADFHRRAEGGEEVAAFGSPEAVAENVAENFRQTRPFVAAPDAPSPAAGLVSAKLHAFLEGAARDFLASHRDLLERRVRTDRIREGHGDLHAGNICFTREGIAVYDCIEFTPRFRCADVACDLAFLAMDLDHRGFPSFSEYFVHRYAEIARDPGVKELMDFYKSYRAIVRAKVSFLEAADPAVEDGRREELRRRAARYFHLAASYDLPPALILLCGLPASGKSWMARSVAPSLRAVALRSDVRRKVLAGVPVRSRRAEAYGTGLYSAENRERTYRSLLEQAAQLLQKGHSVLVDASFSRLAFRRPFLDAAARLDRPFFVIHVTAPEALVRERLRERAELADEPSDADLAVYLEEKERFEEPDEVPAPHLVEIVSGEEPPEWTCARLLDRMVDVAALLS